MKATARKATVEVVEDREPKGYIGPCEHVGCSDDATRVLNLTVNDVKVYTWTCETHAEGLT